MSTMCPDSTRWQIQKALFCVSKPQDIQFLIINREEQQTLLVEK